VASISESRAPYSLEGRPVGDDRTRGAVHNLLTIIFEKVLDKDICLWYNMNVRKRGTKQCGYKTLTKPSKFFWREVIPTFSLKR
jgi:hypothetical protein